MKSSVLHIVVAAGSGSRFGADLPKQFCDMNGIPVLMHTVESLRQSQTGEVVVVLSSDMVELWKDLCEKHNYDSPEIIIGGKTRWQSVKNAIAAKGDDAEIISVHDGARPLISAVLVRKLVECVKGCDKAVIPAVPVTDSLRKVNSDGSNEAVDRRLFYSVQTPQVFDGNLLRRAYSEPESALFTDDASVVENVGATVRIYPGEPTNIKITHPMDIAIAELIQKGLRS
ncbi:MAG: 2-C-methyl-D-erythritol 4-phosphate cytidylyltransferase [Paramuribaculum sp.]|nr:2-C-methyl-D-erythritol 4-phosphate cytidylyltransferase [Paramuribaculum sp.]